MTRESRHVVSRRTALLTFAGVVGGLAGCSGGDGGGGDEGGGDDTATATASPTPDATPTPETEAPAEVTDWLDNVGNHDGSVIDRRGQNEVSVMTGTEGNGGNFGFDPVLIRIDTGTTVTWEWTGKGGSHNVVAESGSDFESELVSEEGFTFEQTFESPGDVTYFCTPHRGVGMKGALIVR